MALRPGGCPHATGPSCYDTPRVTVESALRANRRPTPCNALLPRAALWLSSGTPGCPKTKRRENKWLTNSDHSPAKESPSVDNVLVIYKEKSILINNLTKEAPNFLNVNTLLEVKTILT